MICLFIHLPCFFLFTPRSNCAHQKITKNYQNGKTVKWNCICYKKTKIRRLNNNLTVFSLIRSKMEQFCPLDVCYCDCTYCWCGFPCHRCNNPNSVQNNRQTNKNECKTKFHWRTQTIEIENRRVNWFVVSVHWESLFLRFIWVSVVIPLPVVTLCSLAGQIFNLCGFFLKIKAE